MLEILLCVAYAVLYGLFGYLFILALEWLLTKIPPGRGPMTPEVKSVLQAIIAVLIFIMLIICIFGGNLGRFDVFHLHGEHLR